MKGINFVGLALLTMVLVVAPSGEATEARGLRSPQPLRIERIEWYDLADIADTAAAALGWSERFDMNYFDGKVVLIRHVVRGQCLRRGLIWLQIFSSPNEAEQFAKEYYVKPTAQPFHGTTGYRAEVKAFNEVGFTWAMDKIQLLAEDRNGCGSPDPMPIAEAMYKAWVRYFQSGQPTPTPTPTATPSPTPTLTPTPLPSDLAVDKIVLLQAVEGGQLVAQRPVAVRVFLTWPDPQSSVDVEVDLEIDTQLFETKKHRAKHKYDALEISRLTNSVNFYIPSRYLKPGATSFTARARLNDPNRVDPNPDNNWSREFIGQVSATRPISVLFTNHAQISDDQLQQYMTDAGVFMRNVYPIPDLIPILSWVKIVQWASAGSLVTELEETRQLFNSINPAQRIDYYVGVFPKDFYGKDIHGMSYWGYRRSVLVDQSSIETLAHEVGHDLLGGTEEYDSSNPGLWLPGVSIYKAQENAMEDLGATAAKRYISFMGNAGIAPTWVNAETWNRLVDLLAVPVGDSRAGLQAPVYQMGTSVEEGFLIAGLLVAADR